MLGLFFNSDFCYNISKIEIYDIIKSTANDTFQPASEVLRSRRLACWYHFIRNHKKDDRNIINYSVPNPNKFVRLLKLVDLILEDRILRPSYIPVLN
jgi:hypothetical protein